MGLVAENRLGTDRGILGRPYRLFVARLRLHLRTEHAEEMRVEQRIEFREPFRRRRQRRARGAADVADLSRSEKFDRGEPSHGLFRRDGESGAPQQPGKADKMSDRVGRTAHACASSSIASIFGAI